MDASNDNTPNAEDLAAILNFRQTLLAQNWPDAEAVERILGGRTDACAEFNANRQRGWEGCRIFGVWAGRDRGGYRYPPFQFLEGGLVHPKLPELMDALAHRPDYAPTTTKVAGSAPSGSVSPVDASVYKRWRCVQPSSMRYAKIRNALQPCRKARGLQRKSSRTTLKR